MCLTPSALTDGKNTGFDNEFPEFFDDEHARGDENNNRPIVLRQRVRSEQRANFYAQQGDGHISELNEEEEKTGGDQKRIVDGRIGEQPQLKDAFLV